MSSIDDSQSELKKRSRRRLIGASLLLLGVVAILPPFMSKNPPEPVRSLELRIPTPTTPYQPDAATPPPSDRANRKDSGQLKPEIEKSLPAVVSTDSAAVRAVVPPPEPPLTSESKANDHEKKSSPSQPKTSSQQVTRTPNDTDGWYLQYGVFKDKKNADNTVGLVKRNGINPAIEKLNDKGEVKYIVRSGPYKNRDAAEKVQKKLYQAKIKTILMQPTP